MAENEDSESPEQDSVDPFLRLGGKERLDEVRDVQRQQRQDDTESEKVDHHHQEDDDQGLPPGGRVQAPRLRGRGRRFTWGTVRFRHHGLSCLWVGLGQPAVVGGSSL